MSSEEVKTMFVRALYILLLTIVVTSECVAETAPPLRGVLNYSLPKFPPGLRGIMAGDGEVVVAATIDVDGNVAESVALLSTNEEFAEASLSAVNDWVFAESESETWPRREIMQFDFKRSGVVTSLSHEEAARDGFVSTAYYQIQTVQWQELDSEPQRIAGRMPALSRSALNAHGKKAIVVNFVIGKEGRVRVPVVYGVSNKQLADTVLAAVSSWRYTPPLYQNKQVLAEVTRALVLADSGS